MRVCACMRVRVIISNNTPVLLFIYQYTSTCLFRSPPFFSLLVQYMHYARELYTVLARAAGWLGRCYCLTVCLSVYLYLYLMSQPCLSLTTVHLLPSPNAEPCNGKLRLMDYLLVSDFDFNFFSWILMKLLCRLLACQELLCALVIVNSREIIFFLFTKPCNFTLFWRCES